MKKTLIIYIFWVLVAFLSTTNLADALQHDTTSRLIVAHDANYPPFSSLGEDNQPHGYLIEVWQAFGRANSIAIEFKLGTWQESLDMVKNGEADVHGGLFFSNERDLFLDYGPTITNLSTFLYTLKSASPAEAKDGTIGVVQGGFEEYFMRKEYPNRQLALFAQNRALIDAAKTGKIKVFVADQPTGTFYLKLFGIHDAVNNTRELYSQPLRIAVAEGRHKILEFINYGWPKINPQELKYIHNKWFLPETSNFQWVITYGAFALLALILSFIIRKLGRHAHGMD